MKYNIYADNAATTQLDENAFDAMKPFLLNSYGNASQPYSFSRDARNAIKTARAIIAECIGALPEEIIFTSGGSESDNFAIKGVVDVCETSLGILTSEIEHHAVLKTCREIENNSISLKTVPVDKQGRVSPNTFLDKILHTNNPYLASIMYANNEIGTIQPIRELCAVAHSNNMIFHTDAVQAIGHINIDVKDLGVDLLSASAHKFNGPKGVGFIYIKEGTNIKPIIYGGAQENNYRAGTENIASIVGMAVALKKSCQEMQTVKRKLDKIENDLINTLENNKIDYIRNGSNYHIPGNVSLSFKGVDGEMLLHRLDLMGIYVSTGSACDSKRTNVSHVLKAIDCPQEYIHGTVRFSFGKNNQPEDGACVGEALSKILKNNL